MTSATTAAVSSLVGETAKAAQPVATVTTYKVAMAVNETSPALTLDPRTTGVETAEVAMPRGAVEMAKVVFADARPTDDNAFKIPLATRTLAAVIAEVKP